MKIKAIIHEAEEDSYRAEVPSLPGCATQGETLEELRKNIREAIEGCLLANSPDDSISEKVKAIEAAV